MTIYIDHPHCAQAYMNFTYVCNFSCTLSTGNTHHVHKTDTICYIYIYYAYTLFFLFLPFLAYQKPTMSFPEEREDDEDRFMEYDDSTYLS
jgi:hypothetical protein